MNDPRPELSDEEVRQADKHRGNFRVLTISIVLVVIAFAIVLIYNMNVSPDSDTSLDAGVPVEELAPEAVGPESGENDGSPEAVDPTAGELEIEP